MTFPNSLRHQVIRILRSSFFKTTTPKLFKVSQLPCLHQRCCVWPSCTHCATKWSKFYIQGSSKQLHQNFSKLVNCLVCTTSAAYELPELIAPPSDQTDTSSRGTSRLLFDWSDIDTDSWTRDSQARPLTLHIVLPHLHQSLLSGYVVCKSAF